MMHKTIPYKDNIIYSICAVAIFHEYAYLPTIACMHTSSKSLETMLRLRLIQDILSIFAIIVFISFIYFSMIYTSPPSNLTNKTTTTLEPQPPFSLLIGILTRPDKYDRRHFLRLIYGTQTSHTASIDVKFILCSLTKPEQRAFIALEIMRFDDIIILNCTENMNSGKTYTYFSTLPRILPSKYDYVMKADDDVYLRLKPLSLSLQPLPRLDLYYGFVIPCPSTNPFVHYMSGMGFVLSWDLVEWISSSLIPLNHTFGPEDKLVGEWLNRGNKAKNRFSKKPGMYDYPGTNGRCSHDLIPDTVAVHRVKRWDQWLNVLTFFNVTKEIKPSKLYDL